MMKRGIVIGLLLGWFIGLNAAERTVEEAAAIAVRCLTTDTAMKGRRSSSTMTSMRLVHTAMKTTNTQEAALFIFNHKDKGFVVVSADDRAEEVLCYSREGSYDPAHVNPQFAWWLARYERELSSLDETQVTAKANDSISTHLTAIAPLLDGINWDQEHPYNILCPIDPNDNTRSFTGCAATAAAEIMRYWKYPAKGVGSEQYECVFYDLDSYNMFTGQYSRILKRDTLFADYGNTTYDWNRMRKDYTGDYTQEEADAVATLMFHCGVSCQTLYGGIKADGSAACLESVALGMNSHFNYLFDKYITQFSKWEYGDTWLKSDQIEYSTSNDMFSAYLHNELEEGRPVPMGGTDRTNGFGHAFVCDGRDTNGRFHINWGWSGKYNCYCTLSALKPVKPYDFSDYLDCIVGLRPAHLDTVAVTGVTVTPKAVTLKIRERALLSASIQPDSATVKRVIWSSSDSTVVMVDGGTIRGCKAGEAMVIATSAAAAIADTCRVTVSQDTASYPTCDAYHYTFTTSCKAGLKQLGDYTWNVNMSDATYTGFNGARGAQFGSTSNPVSRLTMTTGNTLACAPHYIVVTASMAMNGDARISVRVDDELLGEKALTDTTATYTFENRTKAAGYMTIEISNTAKAVYMQQIAIHDELPLQVDETETVAPRGVTKIMVNGQLYILKDDQYYTLLGQPTAL